MEFKTKELRGKSPVIVILAISYFAFNIMIICLIIGMHWIPTLIIFLSIITLLILILSLKVRYLIENDRIIKTMIPQIQWLPILKEPKTEMLFFNQIISYKTGQDMNRSFEPFEYLILWFNTGAKWKISSKKETFEEFYSFRDTIIDRINELNLNQNRFHKDTNRDIVSPINTIYSAINTNRKQIKERKSIYDTIWGKIITIFFLIFSLSLILFLNFNKELMKSTYIFRIEMIIIPGTIYLVYRTFFKSKM